MIDTSEVLLLRHREAGLRLLEVDDHTLELRRRDELVATFSSISVTAESIREEADKHAHMGW